MANEQSLESRNRALLLLEEYEELLSPKQQEICDSYFRYDLSLSEIADNLKISRAAVSDAVNKSLAKLEEFESKLGILAEHALFRQMFAEAGRILDKDKQIEAYVSIGKAYSNGI